MNPNFAVITCIENSSDNLGQGGPDGKPSPIEEDAAECFPAWRKFGGAMADIPFYCICPTKRYPSQKTIDLMNKYDVIYIEEYMPNTENFICGYWNVIEVGKWCEKNLEEHFFIHIDLDMKLIREPTPEYFMYDPSMYLAKIGTINKTFWSRDLNPSYKVNFETCFINSWKQSGFYHVWYNELTKYLNETYPNMKHEDIPNFDEMEEHIIDVMYNEGTHPIIPIDNFQMGFWYPIDKMTDGEVKQVHFHHAHYHENKQQVYLKYLKRMKQWK